MTEQGSGIRSMGGGMTPFEYPHGIFTHYSEPLIAETERWVNGVRALPVHVAIYLSGQPDLDSKYRFLNWVTNVARAESTKVEDFFRDHQRPVRLIPPGSWFRQRNIYGIETCQVVSAINGLRFLGLYNPNIHTEERFVASLGRGTVTAHHRPRFETGDIARVLPDLAPDVRLRRSNSVADMVESAANGAAVMFPYSNDHEALIPPGFQLRRGSEGLEVQVVSSTSDFAEFLPVERLIKSEITIVEDPNVVENSVLIIERVDRPQGMIRTLPHRIVTSSGITTVSRK